MSFRAVAVLLKMQEICVQLLCEFTKINSLNLADMTIDI